METPTQAPSQPEPSRTKARDILLGSAALIMIVGGLWYFMSSAPSMQDQGVEDAALSEARVLNGQGDTAAALQKYTEALAAAGSAEDAAYAKSGIALMLRNEGNFEASVAAYKEIANDPQTPGILRAHAIRAMAEMSSYNGDPTIRSLVFSGEPYASFLVGNNYGLATRRLYEYSSSFFPLALSELRIASWYAGALRENDPRVPKLTADQRSAYLKIISDKRQSAEVDIARIRNTPEGDSLMHMVLSARAVLVGLLALSGEALHVEADAEYQAAIKASADFNPVADGRTRYWYAAYLVARGDTTEAILQLKPLYTDARYRRSTVASFFITERNNNLGQKANITRLAAVSPEFKTFLISLGWTDADF